MQNNSLTEPITPNQEPGIVADVAPPLLSPTPNSAVPTGETPAPSASSAILDKTSVGAMVDSAKIIPAVKVECSSLGVEEALLSPPAGEPSGKLGSEIAPLAQVKPKRTHLKFVSDTRIPDPPRKSNGKICWQEVTPGMMVEISDNYPISQVAKAWGLSPSSLFNLTHELGIVIGKGKWTTRASQQRRKLLEASAPPPKPVKPMPWDSPAKFLHMLWEVGAPLIAELYDCDNTILGDHAKALDLPKPTYGYWQKKNREIPAFVKEKMAELDAKEAAAQSAARPSEPSSGAVSGAATSEPLEAKAPAPAAELPGDVNGAAPTSPILGGEACPRPPGASSPTTASNESTAENMAQPN